MFKDFALAPADPILGLTAAYRADPRAEKVNLGVGVFMDETGTTPVLRAVKDAESALLAAETSKSYLPIAGTDGFRAAVARLLFAGALPAERTAVLQAPGGTGALAAAAHLVVRARPGGRVWIPDPTWGNHKAIFPAAGLSTAAYPYFSRTTRGVDFDACAATLSTLGPDAVVLLHACCHNPTGADFTLPQWEEVARIAAERGWLPVVDFAYQGFGEGLAEDRAGLLALLTRVPEAIVCSSFSKNMGLYAERTGAITLVGEDAGATARAESQAKQVARTLWSNPPKHGAAVAEAILSDDARRTAWEGEVAAMCGRIRGMRAALVEGLRTRRGDVDFAALAAQKGMFSYLALPDGAVARLREEKAIYMVAGGRINVAGLLPRQLDYVCDSLAEVL
ncbi:MAG: aspartate/tyrosine/aromatic aminotransferase [Kiritimatiellae bacterium]|nr:aspartate/tyrosine/aromatic aminotransferase [Kiritimatiellia bacterium]